MKVKKLCCLLFFMGMIVAQTSCQKPDRKRQINPSENLPATLEIDVTPANPSAEPVASENFEVKGLIKKVKKE